MVILPGSNHLPDVPTSPGWRGKYGELINAQEDQVNIMVHRLQRALFRPFRGGSISYFARILRFLSLRCADFLRALLPAVPQVREHTANRGCSGLLLWRRGDLMVGYLHLIFVVRESRTVTNVRMSIPSASIIREVRFREHNNCCLCV